MEHNYYLGIDLDDENAIVSFFQLNNKEPETVSPVAGSEIFQIGSGGQKEGHRTVVRGRRGAETCIAAE